LTGRNKKTQKGKLELVRNTSGSLKPPRSLYTVTTVHQYKFNWRA